MKRLILDVRDRPGGNARFISDPPDHSGRARLSTTAGWDGPEVGSRFWKYLERTRVFADVGAAEGFFSLSLLRHTDARVFAFDRADSLAGLLLENLEVGDKVVNPDLAHEVGPVLLKIEVEGEEYEVLEGFREVLAWPDTRVMVKVHDGPTESRCVRLLESLGFGVDIVGAAWWRRSLGQDRLPSEASHWLIAEKTLALA